MPQLSEFYLLFAELRFLHAAKRRALGMKLTFFLYDYSSTASGPPSLTREGFIETEMPLSKYNLYCIDIN